MPEQTSSVKNKWSCKSGIKQDLFFLQRAGVLPQIHTNIKSPSTSIKPLNHKCTENIQDNYILYTHKHTMWTRQWFKARGRWMNLHAGDLVFGFEGRTCVGVRKLRFCSNRIMTYPCSDLLCPLLGLDIKLIFTSHQIFPQRHSSCLIKGFKHYFVLRVIFLLESKGRVERFNHLLRTEKCFKSADC